MKKYSRAMVLTAPEKLEMQQFPLPEIDENDGLLQVEFAGVCGSDPSIFGGRPTRGPRPYPIILGHEVTGRIVEMGTAAQKRFQAGPGDRVVLEYAFGCGADFQLALHRIGARGNQPGVVTFANLDYTQPAGAVWGQPVVMAERGNWESQESGSFQKRGAFLHGNFKTID